MTMLKSDDILSISEAANLLGVSKATIRNWEKKGSITAHRHPVNGYRIFSKSELNTLTFEPNPNVASSHESRAPHPVSPRRPGVDLEDLGQHMTPVNVAMQMTNFFQTDPRHWRVLDPACGDGNLLIAAAERLLQAGCSHPVKQLSGIDLDPKMAATARKRLASLLGVSEADVRVYSGDFLKEVEPTLFKEGAIDIRDFNIVISNPPYGRNREFAFFDTCAARMPAGSEMVFLMPLSFIDRVTDVFSVPLAGRPLGVTTGHAIVYHKSGTSYSLQSVKHSQSNRTSFRVLSGLKLYELGAGEPPQDKFILENKPYSSSHARDGWLPCLRTGDIHPFTIETGRLYVQYGVHLAHPKDIARFEGPKLFVRRVPIWGGRTLGAAYCDEKILCCGDVLVVRHETDDVELLKGLCHFLNSEEAAKAIATARPSLKHRDSFPKISAKDLNQLFERALPSDEILSKMASSQPPSNLTKESSDDAIADSIGARLIERAFPTTEVSIACVKEKSTRQSHISTLQMWWARRPLAVCRSAIFSALLPDISILEKTSPHYISLDALVPGDAPLIDRVSDFVARLSNWESASDKTILKKAREIIHLFWKVPPTFLDFFAGGGSLPLESLRLGLTTKASDLNPVAVAILKTTLTLLPSSDERVLQAYQRICDDTARSMLQETQQLYPCADGVPLAYFWFRTFRCPHCSGVSPLFKDLVLSAKGKSIVVRLHAKEGCSINVDILENPAPEELAKGKQGNVFASFVRCYFCDEKTTTQILQKQGREGKLGEMLYAKRVRMNDGTSKYLPVSSDDMKTARFLHDNCENVMVPDVAFDLNGIRHTWAQQYGVTSTAALYNPRQSTVFSKILSEFTKRSLDLRGEMSKSEAYTVGLLLSFTLNRLAGYSNRHSWWQANGEFPAHIFGRQAIPFVWNYVEIPFTSPAAGGLESASTWILKAARHIQQIKSGGEVFQTDAKTLSIESASIDLIAIDPPYYDSIAYSYLSDVFYAWMKPLLEKHDPPLFIWNETPKEQEAIVDRKHKLAPKLKTDRHFRQKMSEALTEGKRVLKPGGRMLIMYGHKQAIAWAALFDAMAEAGIQPICSWPLHMERGSKFRHGKVEALATATLLVCGLSSSGRQPSIEWKAIEPVLKGIVQRVMNDMNIRGLRKQDVVTAAIAPSMQPVLLHEKILEDGKILSTVTILDRILALTAQCSDCV